jgi:Flp pilus assembly pilin Flp
MASYAAAFLKDQRGTVAVEYGIIAMAMFAAIIPGFLYVASGIQLKFEDIGSYFGS